MEGLIGAEPLSPALLTILIYTNTRRLPLLSELIIEFKEYSNISAKSELNSSKPIPSVERFSFLLHDISNESFQNVRIDPRQTTLLSQRNYL